MCLRNRATHMCSWGHLVFFACLFVCLFLKYKYKSDLFAVYSKKLLWSNVWSSWSPN